MVHINWKVKSGEISFVCDTNRTKSKIIYQKDFSTFLKIIFKIAFDEMKLNKITSEVFDIRPWTREILEKSGFNICDILKNHVMIEDKQIDSILYQKILRD